MNNVVRCEMATINLEDDHRGKRICALAYWYKPCEGLREQRAGCPHWKGSQQE